MESLKIILASSSPRRIEMLRKNCIEPTIIPPDVNEIIPEKMTMEQAVMYLAIKKALNVEKKWLKISTEFSVDQVIIAADTVVYKNMIIGKPADYEEAVHILRLLRNTSHFVATGVAIIKPGTFIRKVFCETTEVFFHDYSDEEIIKYVNTDEPYDKAGGYAIQGGWGKHISHILGDYDNVVGFPWTRIKQELNKE